MEIDVFPGKLRKEGIGTAARYVLSRRQVAWFRKWFPMVENARIAEASGMSNSTLHKFAKQLGLRKSEEGMRGIRERQKEKCLEVCERNGYYDSIRGKPVSEETRRGLARMWQEIRDGKREHPIRKMQQDAERYAEWRQRMSAMRKEMQRKEELRTRYGLRRHTRLITVVANPYTRRQKAHRASALRRGYILMADCSEQGGERYNIYYDEETERTAAFERNLEMDGFHVMPLNIEE